MQPTLKVSGDALILLVGPSGSGKTTFSNTHFSAYQVLSSDDCRAWVSDRACDQDASRDAFDILYAILEKRLRRGVLTVIDATNLDPENVRCLIKFAETFKRAVYAVVFALPLDQCIQWNQSRPSRQVPVSVLTSQHNRLPAIQTFLQNEGITTLVIDTPHIIPSTEIHIRATESYTDSEVHINDHGPFDIIGDIHGCMSELLALLEKLEYKVAQEGDSFTITHPQKRRLIFVGDLVDRGPSSLGVLRLVRSATQQNMAYCILGNHDDKLRRKLKGKKVQVRHGLETTLAEMKDLDQNDKLSWATFLQALPLYLVLAGGKLVVCHAGILHKDIGKMSDRIRRFCLYGDITGRRNEEGFPIRGNWAKSHDGLAAIVYGHTPVKTTKWQNNTLNIDTGCVFGGALSALQFPERKIVCVSAKQCYSKGVTLH